MTRPQTALPIHRTLARAVALADLMATLASGAKAQQYEAQPTPNGQPASAI